MLRVLARTHVTRRAHRRSPFFVPPSAGRNSACARVQACSTSTLIRSSRDVQRVAAVPERDRAAQPRGRDARVRVPTQREHRGPGRVHGGHE